MKLIFVYNADSGMLNTVKDIGQKLFSPQNYDCFLCSLTHGTFRENREWKDFRENSLTDMEFLHRDEFEQSYDTTMEYPCIIRQDRGMEVVVSKEQLGSLSGLDELIDTVKSIEVEDKKGYDGLLTGPSTIPSR